MDKLGVAILVDGEIVAWFAELTDEVQEWCTENYFGRWLAWRAETPKVIPLTEDEEKDIARKVEEWSSIFTDKPLHE